MIPARIHALLNGVADGERNFPPTLLYNEGWMLRLILDWFAHHQGVNHPLAFMPGSSWFSEALLPSAFLPRRRGDPLGESRTHADGVAGHLKVGRLGKADLELAPSAGQFVVVEAKMMSGLSKGTSNAVTFGQAARNVACMAETLSRAGQSPEHLARLGFIVLAPQAQIDRGYFQQQMNREAIGSAVLQRAAAYEGEKTVWYQQWFAPTLEWIGIGTISWESVISFIGSVDAKEGDEIALFYRQCLLYCGTSGG